MSDAAANNPFSPDAQGDAAQLPDIKLHAPSRQPDLATILGLFFTIGFILAAILAGSGNADFINLPSILIVVLGTMSATAISYTAEELAQAGKVIGKSLMKSSYDYKKLASTLIDLSVVAKKKGILALSAYERELDKNRFLKGALQMGVDGFPPDDIDFLLTQEIEALKERHKRAASIARRAAEIAPAMGLIGTLVGLVQMLANLENPETIGPAMAVALLTTFYGAIIGMVIMGPLAVKLDKRSSDEELSNVLIRTATVSIARQDNPRKLEMLLNSELPPSGRIRYFD